ncbi:Ig-like domain-containing protein [Vibrio crassostreae]|uniref:Ig-like domain-containing protein n=1 Tax=Vibrio crassostreae TaxID=246167 RepID=UPI001B30CF48|nr:Ig-like domain-containing protein [Vibrio crassostreae]
MNNKKDFIKESLLAALIGLALSGCGGGGNDGGGTTPPPENPEPTTPDNTVVEKVRADELPVSLESETLSDPVDYKTSSALSIPSDDSCGVTVVSAGVSKFVEDCNSPVKGLSTQDDIATMLNTVNQHTLDVAALWGYSTPFEYLDIINADKALKEDLVIDMLAYDATMKDVHDFPTVIDPDIVDNVIARAGTCTNYSNVYMCGAQDYFATKIITNGGTLELAEISKIIAEEHIADPSLITTMSTGIPALWMANNGTDAAHALIQAYKLHSLNEQGIEVSAVNGDIASYSDGTLKLPAKLYTSEIDNRLINSSIQALTYDMVSGQATSEQSLFAWLENGVELVFSQQDVASWETISNLSASELTATITSGGTLSPEIDAAILNYLLLANTEESAKLKHTMLIEWVKLFKHTQANNESREGSIAQTKILFNQMGFTSPSGLPVTLDSLADILIDDATEFASNPPAYKSLALDGYGSEVSTFATISLDERSDTGVSNKDNITKENTPWLSGFVDKKATHVSIHIEGANMGQAAVDESGRWEMKINDVLTDGKKNPTITVVIPVDGGTLDKRYTGSFYIDTQIQLTVTEGDGVTHTDGNPYIQGTADTGDTLTVKVTSGTTGETVYDKNVAISGSNTWRANLSPLPDDAYFWTAKSIDIAGNEIEINGNFIVDYRPPITYP